jgi:hypothetical protein
VDPVNIIEDIFLFGVILFISLPGIVINDIYFIGKPVNSNSLIYNITGNGSKDGGLIINTFPGNSENIILFTESNNG